MDYKYLRKTDKEIYDIICEEDERQHVKLEMIASENFTSPAVLEATGSVLTNKYAEGYPNKRYYGGCEIVDKAEILAIERAKELFQAEYVNVQPHCGSSANMAVYMGFLNPGDKVVGMDLAHGGHLTHGASVSFSGKQYDACTYGIDKKTELIDYDEVARIVTKHKPKLVVAGASAYPRVIDFEKFAEIAHANDAMLLVDMAHIAGLVAAGEHPSPIPYADVVTTTTHKTLRGPRGGMILVGKNKENPFNIKTASGITRKYSGILNSIVFPGIQGGPLMHVIAAKAVALKECLQDDFKVYQRQVKSNAKILAASLEKGGARIVSGGTDNHIVLVDLQNIGVTGKDAEHWLDDANISSNKNAIPFDPQPPMVTSGIRLGTAAITSRNMKETEMEFIAKYILKALHSKGNADELKKIANDVKDFSSNFGVRE